METQATAKYVKVQPQKVRLVGEMIKGKQLEWALNALSFSPRRAAKVLKSVVDSAKANAAEKNIDVDTLVVKNVVVNGGPFRPYRFMPRARGMAYRIRHRTSHITVVLEDLA